jgi:hypothetical protein
MKILGKYGGLVNGCTRCRRPVDDHAATCPGLMKPGGIPERLPRVYDSGVRYTPTNPENNWLAPKAAFVCECGANAWADSMNSASVKCVVCSTILSYGDFTKRRAEAVWPPIATGIIEAPLKERWRGSVLGLGHYNVEPGMHVRFSTILPCGAVFQPKRFRVTANSGGVFVKVAINDFYQYGPDYLPQDTFAEDRVNDRLHLICGRGLVDVYLRNASTETRHGSAWFEGEKG